MNMAPHMASQEQQPITVLKTRPEFLAVAGTGRRWITKGFILQAAPDSRDDGRIGVGFTASRKVGKAVVRNRAKRRLRALARTILTREGKANWSYVLVARHCDSEPGFARLEADLRWALRKLADGADLRSARKPRRTEG